MKGTNPRLRILYLSKILLEETDDNHYLSQPKLLEKLKNYGQLADRRAIYDDIEALKTFGIDIVYEQKKGYAVVNRDFETAELKLLADAVASAKFITSSKSKILIKKISKLSSVHESEKIRKSLKIYESGKTRNQRIYYNIDKIQMAISERKKISFRYFDYNTKKEKEYREGIRICSPYILVCDDNQYYAVSYYNKRPENPTNFRIDRMDNIKILDEKAHSLPDNFNIDRYTNSTFDMFSGNEERVCLEFIKTNAMVNIVIERFGMDINITETDDSHFVVNPVVKPSQGFFSWIFKLGGKVRILGPDQVKNQYVEMVEIMIEKYKRF